MEWQAQVLPYKICNQNWWCFMRVAQLGKYLHCFVWGVSYYIFEENSWEEISRKIFNFKRTSDWPTSCVAFLPAIVGVEHDFGFSNCGWRHHHVAWQGTGFPINQILKVCTEKLDNAWEITKTHSQFSMQKQVLLCYVLPVCCVCRRSID